jgi:hypothetical protein
MEPKISERVPVSLVCPLVCLPISGTRRSTWVCLPCPRVYLYRHGTQTRTDPTRGHSPDEREGETFGSTTHQHNSEAYPWLA